MQTGSSSILWDTGFTGVPANEYPTVLIAIDDAELRADALNRFRELDCLLLETENGPGALHLVRMHSRPIHLMLTNLEMDDRFLNDVVHYYRKNMTVLFVAGQLGQQQPYLITSEEAVHIARPVLTRIPNQTSKAQLEEELIGNMRVARQRYSDCNVRLREVVQQRDTGVFLGSDGTLAVSEAIAQAQHALADYKRALATCTRFIMNLERRRTT